MTTPTTSGGPAFFGLEKLVERTIEGIDSHIINNAIKEALHDLCFNKKRLTLKVNDPSYKLRHQYAVMFWTRVSKEKMETCETPLSTGEAKALVKRLKRELNNKSYLYPEESNENEERLDKFYSQDPKPKARHTSTKQPVWYVTSKCENKFYLKSTNSSEDEKEVNRTDFKLCSYSLICPGDEFQINVDGDKKKVSIVRCKRLTSEESNEDKAKFIENFLNHFEYRSPSYDECTWVLDCYDILCKRYKGIWSHIKNDEALFKDIQCVKNVLKLSCLLTEKMLAGNYHTFCGEFLEDLSCSLFFKTALPLFIQSNSSELSNDDLEGLKLLLELMMEHSPKTASKILKVAKHLAHAMHVISSAENATDEKSHCQGVDYLVHLGEILAKAVPGYEDVDTSNCEWTELPTIPTDQEILTAFDLKGLESIRREEPYESTKQYLDVNYRLLRAECFRNLCTGLRNFRIDERTNDARQMKMYRILKLDTITRGDTQTTLVLNCEDYYKKEDSMEEGEVTSSEILYGSLMCISLNKKFDRLIWATADKCELQKDSNIKTVWVKLCSKRNKLKNIDVLLKLLALTNEGDYALMAESPTFYRAFGPCMDRLQEMHQKGNMPLIDELVLAKRTDPPTYTQDKNKKCDWSIIFKKSPGYDFTFPKDEQLSPVEQFKHLRNTLGASESFLDETQLKAVENFLENRVSLIQGPPGTGKSFLGSKILRLMLSMGIHEKGHPILVMTYKNYALDHFLKSCVGVIPNIVRIGHEDKDLSSINLRNLNQRFAGELKFMYDEATQKMGKLLVKLERLFKCLSNQVSTLQLFLEVATEDHIRFLLSEDPDQDVDESIVDQLLDDWKQKYVPKKMKELLRESLNRWLPKTKIQERCDHYKKKVHDQPRKVSVSQSSTNDEEECLDEITDRKFVTQERKKEVVDDFTEKDREIVDKSTILEEACDDEPLTGDLKVPFFCLNNYEETEERFDEQINLWDLSQEERIGFICDLQRKLIRKFTKAVKDYELEAGKRQNIWDNCTVKFLKTFDVIGMTVTGAASRLHLLDKLEPRAVIVEEAAEIIEGQLVSVIPPTTQHLVMLGDQKQLQPRLNCYELKRKYLDCSMFERLINNKMFFQQLGRQCRMRDDIAQLLRSLNIYKHLETNDELTRNNVPPECIECSLYFIQHTTPEEKVKGSNSFWNPNEIYLILEAAKKLLKSGYSADAITVLCPYRVQVDKMEAAFRNTSFDPKEEHFTKLKDIKITTIDSFQGEENKVILLSLVRSNQEEKIGFLAQENRICVAISRAKCALYIFGNRAVYRRSQNWEKVIKFLEKKGLIGRSLKFKDDPEKIDEAEDEKSFDRLKLSHRELTLLSEKCVAKLDEIAGLANLKKEDVDNVDLDVRFTSPKKKGKEIFSMISKDPEFSREKLACILEEAKLHAVVKDLPQIFRRGADSPVALPNKTIEN